MTNVGSTAIDASLYIPDFRGLRKVVFGMRTSAGIGTEIHTG